MFTLAFLLVVAIVGLGILSYFTVQLYTRAIRAETELGALRTRYDQELKQWNDYGAALRVQHEAFVSKHNDEVKRWSEYSTAVQAENQRLSKWRNVANADVRATEMMQNARVTLEKAEADAGRLVAEAQEQARAIIAEAEQRAEAQLASAKETANAVTSEAKTKAKALTAETQAILDSATMQATKMLDSATKKAEETGGSAYEAMRNAALYEKSFKAMKRAIDGYGDEYIIPQQSLLDDLADDFSHTQAGQELKRARETTKVMIRNGSAAACGYVESSRRETAINFVVDAFNGKVDSILSRVKHDNAGKLEQQMRDAFTLVNYNGRAFRDAQITEAFLAARLDELKWAAIVHQFALEEREEQRRLKEQIREEARAARERERALREAAKQEDMLRKAIEQVQEQFEHASGEQRVKFEERLHEMAERLRQAEERKQRAVSMAQQTSKGYVYVLSNIGSFGEDVYKIGLTRRWDPMERVRELGDASVPFGFDVHAMILSENAPKLEQELHEHFMLTQVNKTNRRKEFFRVSLGEIREEIERLGVTTGVAWTMTADAKEYRETLAIEKGIKEDPAERDAWIKRQRRLELMGTEVSDTEGGGDGEE